MTTPPDQETKPEDRVPPLQKTMFAGGIVCGAMGYNGVQIIGKPVLNIIFGMNPAVIGTLLALMRLWDGLLDPIMGRISDNSRRPYGRRKPYIIIGAVLTGLTFPLIWLMSPGWSSNAQIAYLAVACMLFYAAFTIFSVPWATLSTELTPDTDERTRVRAAITMVGTFVFLAYGWVFALTQQGWLGSPLTSIRTMAVVLGVLMVIFGVLAGIFPKERYRRIGQHQPKVKVLHSFKVFLADPTYLKLTGIGTGIILGNQTIDFVAQYVAMFYVFDGDLKRGSMAVAMGITIGRVMEFLTAWALSRYFARMDKRRILTFAVTVTMIGTLAKWYLFNPQYPYLFLLVGLYMAPANAAFWTIYSSMQSDFPDYDEHRSGLRREGLLGALNGWLIKIAVSISLVASGAILNFTGFQQSLRGDQPDGTFTMMRILLIAVPCVFYLISLFCIRAYPLGRTEMNQIRADLEQRRDKV